ncbi:hypothetical protein HMPREF0636_1450 [Porphyromonas catoniae ATCC 51270]|uniref:Uncharacterized protein n=1 Tax=Porphyromonas catoniae ATCC 51270 TaxID=887901 RepID=Z4WST2_9PORP|nr:hypothetical protein HMPREF0636_1450 [Porphyromonas catoniae ATCC 51270]
MQNKKTSFFLQLFQYPFRSSPLFHLTPTFTYLLGTTSPRLRTHSHLLWKAFLQVKTHSL